MDRVAPKVYAWAPTCVQPARDKDRSFTAWSDWFASASDLICPLYFFYIRQFILNPAVQPHPVQFSRLLATISNCSAAYHPGDKRFFRKWLWLKEAAAFPRLQLPDLGLLTITKLYTAIGRLAFHN
jgi:hypothetical protein